MKHGNEPHVVILGGGPAGVGGAYYLRKRGRAAVTLLEQQTVVGGNAGSFEAFGQRLDYGSHRLHYACDPEILSDIRSLLGDDLLSMPRHGRIRLRGRWLHFPIKPLDLMLRLDKGFAAGAARDMVMRMVPHRNGAEGPETFATVLQANLGPTICEHFYFPYARKLWGREPDELSAIQARKRVSAGTFRKLAQRLAKPPGAGRYFYPRLGYGQISEVYADAARQLGAELLLGSRVVGLEAPGVDGRWKVTAECAGERRTIEADYVWSTIPTPIVARGISPAAPPAVAEAASRIQYRAMVLVYLNLASDQFTTTDAHYFPEADVCFTRVSEPKNYWRPELAAQDGAPAAEKAPVGSTTLCAELPCSIDDAWWSMSDEELGRMVAADLAKAGLALGAPPASVHVRRLQRAYPIYLDGYEAPFGTLDRWAESLPRFLTYGRQGLFAHDNTHHALYMASAAANCLVDGRFDAERWSRYREIFATHVVED